MPEPPRAAEPPRVGTSPCAGTAPCPGRAGPAGPRPPAAHASTPLRGVKVGQIPPNPPIQRGFEPQSPLSDTHPARPPKTRRAS
jgi:hypothetical protein